MPFPFVRQLCKPIGVWLHLIYPLLRIVGVKSQDSHHELARAGKRKRLVVALQDGYKLATFAPHQVDEFDRDAKPSTRRKKTLVLMLAVLPTRQLGWPLFVVY